MKYKLPNGGLFQCCELFERLHALQLYGNSKRMNKTLQRFRES